MRAWLLGSAGWMPAAGRETTCVLVRDGDDALLLDAGTGARRLVTHRGLLAGVRRLDVLLTHFHLDHVCGLAYLPALGVAVTIWAPGRALHGRSSAELLAPMRTAPISPFAPDVLGEVRELVEGEQRIGAAAVVARAQPRHWSPTMGLRIGGTLALATDTAYDPGTARLAAGVAHLLHEAWSDSDRPRSAEADATGADAGRAAAEARARRLTLVHLDPTTADHRAVLADARRRFPAAVLGEDGAELPLG